ncbi:MAG TPA: ATP-binding protein [Gemmatimonadaceae bacterium]|nr:ATP-binding protein [Gemmatimonadaceae bacterium]
MNSSRGERTRAAAAPLDGEWLAELLSAVAEARDFPAAAGLFLAQVTERVGGSRARLLEVSDEHQALEQVAAYNEGDTGAEADIALDDAAHPLVLSVLSLLPVSGSGSASGIPFEEWTAVPYPRPLVRGAPPLLDETRTQEQLSTRGYSVIVGPETGRRLGHTPAGVLLFEGTFAQPVATALIHTSMLAGPVLSRLSSADEFQRSAERLDQQRDLLTAIVNSLPDPIVITDAANDIVVQNRRAEHLLSFTEEDSDGRRRAVEINNLLFTSYLSRAVITGGVSSGSRELNLVDPDEGTDLLFEVLAHPLSGAAPSGGSFVSVLRDVTDLRRASNELERQVQRVRLAEIDATRERDRLNLILENVADPILVTDDRSNIILMNQQAEQLFQENAQDHRARAQAVRANDTRFTTFISDFTLSPALARREQMRLAHPASGREIPMEVVSGKIMNQRGEPLAIVSVLHDLTKQVENERLYEELKKFSGQLEERIRAATADLAEQNARLQWQSRELEKANRLKSEFLASMSHELRTPINALIGYTALMLDRIYGDLTGKQEEGLRRIQASAQHLLALINDILDLAKIEAGKMPMHLEETSLQHLIGEITQQIEPLVRKKQLEYRCDVPANLAPMFTDRVKVKQILLNLLSNAVKFTHKGHVALTAVPIDDLIRIDVSDTGIGILPRDLEAIWEDFRQLDQSRTREYGGTGLGLSITRKLVERLGGTVTVTSTPGDGSVFSVVLPLRSPSASAEDRSPFAGVRIGE